MCSKTMNSEPNTCHIKCVYLLWVQIFYVYKKCSFKYVLETKSYPGPTKIMKTMGIWSYLFKSCKGGFSFGRFNHNEAWSVLSWSVLIGGKFICKKNPLQDLFSSMKAVISTNQRAWILTGHVTFKLRYNQIYQMKTTKVWIF